MPILALIVAATVGGAASAPCVYDRAAMLALSPQAFDQDLSGGWRALDDRHCDEQAADLIGAYRESRRATLTAAEIHSLYWHEGQVRAEAGQSAAAVPLLLAGVDPAERWDFRDYALGTVAFLQHDLPALRRARDRLAAQPKPKDWDAQSTIHAMVDGVAMVGVVPWPPNLNVLDGLIACFDKPYAKAYDVCIKSGKMTVEKP